MRAQELLETLTDDELKKRADGCFIQAENTGLYERAFPEEKHRLLTEADFYLKALIWRHDDRISRRDFRLEIWVIVLIGIEIILSLIGLWAGYQQGKVLDKQTTALTHMDTSTAATATSLNTLVDEQDKSLARLNEMNDKLQASLSATGRTASATRMQLQILQKEQAERLAQQSRKPKLALYIGTVPVTAVSANFPIREQTDTSVTFDLNLKNEGDATANKIVLRAVVLAKDAALKSSVPYEHAVEPADNAFHTFFIDIDLIRPRVHTLMIITISFPKGRAPFQVSTLTKLKPARRLAPSQSALKSHNPLGIASHSRSPLDPPPGASYRPPMAS